MDNTEVVKKKRGRKKKSEIQAIENELKENPVENVPKKRGRKPKGGKLILKNDESTKENKSVPNVILHLKCSLKDIAEQNTENVMLNDPLMYNPEVPPNIQSYNQEKHNYFNLEGAEKETSLAYKKIDNQTNERGYL